jgi:predicted NBD/HSP70 family sugar kinase
MIKARSQHRLRAPILAALEDAPRSRAEIARLLSVARSTASSAISELIDEGIIETVDEHVPTARKSAGRPGELVALKARHSFLVGIDFGRLSLKVAISDLNYRLIDEIDCAFDSDTAAEAALSLAAQHVETLIARNGIDRRLIEAVGIGVPGPVEAATGMLHPGSILASWVGADVPARLSERLGLPVYMDNDANLGALAESRLGGGVGSSVMLYVLLSVGVGLGIVIEGQIFRGAYGMAGQLAHVVTDENGPLCHCGSRGCLEAQISVNALNRSLEPTHRDIAPIEMLRLAAEGSPGPARVVADAGAMAGRALGALCNYFNPDLILVGGELTRAGPVLLNAVKDAMRRTAIARALEHVDIRPGALGDRAELFGTLLFAHERARRALHARNATETPADADPIEGAS